MARAFRVYILYELPNPGTGPFFAQDLLDLPDVRRLLASHERDADHGTHMAHMAFVLGRVLFEILRLAA